jgi:hypothetical protein
MPVEIFQFIREIFEATQRKVHFVFGVHEVKGIVEFKKPETIHPCKCVGFQVHLRHFRYIQTNAFNCFSSLITKGRE